MNISSIPKLGVVAVSARRVARLPSAIHYHQLGLSQHGCLYNNQQHRFGSSVAKYSNIKDLPIYLVAIPLTSTKSYVYCKHTKKALPAGKEPLDVKAASWAAKAWKKMEDSDNKINVAIVGFVKRMLDRIPWDEGSLRSIPSQNSIVRELKSNEDGVNILGSTSDLTVKPSVVDLHSISSDQLEKIPLFYPKGMVTQSKLTEQLKQNAILGESHHKKYLLYSLVLLPFTLPVALLPVVPNVPGFYVAYRAWCHFTALRGARYLSYLIGLPPSTTGVHLEFIEVEGLSDLYLNTKDELTKANVQTYVEPAVTSTDSASTVVLAEDTIESIAAKFGAPELNAALLTALHQEVGKLKKTKPHEG
ncbi:unnamed protein product [Kuraishia capsulata CBS 1993]|uniref:Uncharacterized protein n=1 Tax=Kuraishia capsulata CBS 1993 TaxID=1382522 RepID=W6MS09_9ASCO|nr:uncharacterized protein KUCA_T00005548001 [Kuraishia capsulata CBS 1993]CDK29556.1 unnamed protein product [Kuraishia capsulata CBS 1993]